MRRSPALPIQSLSFTVSVLSDSAQVKQLFIFQVQVVPITTLNGKNKHGDWWSTDQCWILSRFKHYSGTNRYVQSYRKVIVLKLRQKLTNSAAGTVKNLKVQQANKIQNPKTVLKPKIKFRDTRKTTENRWKITAWTHDVLKFHNALPLMLTHTNLAKTLIRSFPYFKHRRETLKESQSLNVWKCAENDRDQSNQKMPRSEKNHLQ